MKYKLLSAVFIVLVSVGLYHISAYLLKPALLPEPGSPGKLQGIVLANADRCLRASNSEDWLKPLKSQLVSLVTHRNSTYSIYVKPLDSDSSLTINNEQMQAASMIKLFIMAEAFRQEKIGLLHFDEESVITSKVKVGGAGILQDVPDGSRKTLRQLIELMIIASDNTATNLVIDRLTMKSINNLIVRLGFTNTMLQRKMMDFESIKTGKENYTSVVDLGVMLEKIYFGQCIGPEQDAEMLKILLKQEDNDKIPALLPADVKVAHKTGELVGIFHDGGIVYGPKRNYVVCIMTKNITDTDEAVHHIAAISKDIYQFLNKGVP